MSEITLSLSDSLAAEMEKRARTAGFSSKEDYLWELARVDCEQSQLERNLEERVEGPFEPLEPEDGPHASAALKLLAPSIR